MTTGPLNGNDVLIYIGGAQIACLQDCEFSSENTEIEVKCKDYSGSLGGSNAWSVSGSGIFRFDAGYGAMDILTAHKNKTTVTVKFGNDIVGDQFITGDCTIPTFTWSGPLDNAATFNIDLKGQGDYTIGTNV